MECSYFQSAGRPKPLCVPYQVGWWELTMACEQLDKEGLCRGPCFLIVELLEFFFCLRGYFISVKGHMFPLMYQTVENRGPNDLHMLLYLGWSLTQEARRLVVSTFPGIRRTLIFTAGKTTGLGARWFPNPDSAYLKQTISIRECLGVCICEMEIAVPIAWGWRVNEIVWVACLKQQLVIQRNVPSYYITLIERFPFP